MYVKSLYRWASSEDIGYLERNPIASYKMPKPPQQDDEIIVIHSTKTNRKRTVPLNKRCMEILSLLDQHERYIFPYNRYSFQSYFYDRAKELHQAELVTHRYRPYDLRHTAISRWIEAGIPVAQVSKWAGNSAEVIWKHYCNTTQEYEMPTL